MVASRAHGVVSHAELRAVGLSADEIRTRRESGSLIVEFRGVYRVGHRAPSVEARYMAAVKASGEGAVLSGLAAAWLWGLIKRAAPPPETTARTERRVRGVTARRRRILDSRDATVHRSIPITTVPVTLIRLPSLLSFDDLTRAVHEADVRHGTRPEHIEAALERHPTAKGRATLLAIAKGDAPTILSKLEKLFLGLVRSHGLPLPQTNRPQGAHYVDCRWPRHELTVELDSYRFHRTRRAWEQDRERERAARRRGDEFRRYTWTDVTERPAATVAELRTLVEAAGP
jgi:hypothetical protein